MRRELGTEAVVDEAPLPTGAGRLTHAPLRSHEPAEKAEGTRAGTSPSGVPSALERLAADKLRVQAGEDVGPADVVEADELAADRDQDAGLARHARKRRREVLQTRCVALEERDLGSLGETVASGAIDSWMVAHTATWPARRPARRALGYAARGALANCRERYVANPNGDPERSYGETVPSR